MYTKWEDYFDNILPVMAALEQDKRVYPHVPVYPSRDKVFAAFEYFDPSETKVVILGQDCYHGPGQAMGLCFSVPSSVAMPPSLRNINKELQSNLGVRLENGDLTHWAQQGVLLLNCALTVREKSPGSHSNIWSDITDDIVRILSSTQKEICFLLWGKYAQKKQDLINTNNGHLVLTASHPSPLSANRGGWFGNGHFGTVNSFLESCQRDPILWSSSSTSATNEN